MKFILQQIFQIQVYDRLQPLGVSLSHQGMLETMSAISNSFNTELTECVKQGKKFRIIGDNVNFHMGVAQARKNTGKVSHMEHWFGSAAIVQNVSFPDLPGTHPQHDLRYLPAATFMLDEHEWNGIMFKFSLIMTRILVDFFPWLKFAKSAVSQVIDDIPEGLKEPNLVIPLPILHKNEQKYAEVVDILDSYQELCETTYEAAEKPLQEVHIGGDQLTRERFSGAKRLRAAALSETERFESLFPITFELFHLQMTVLTTFYQILYDTQNTDSFTLHSQKIRLLRKDADGNDVKNHYDSCRELAVSVIKAYVIEAACEQFGLPDTEVVPENIPEYQNMSNEEIKLWLVSQVSPIIISICSVSRDVMNGNYVENTNTDKINCYGKTVIELGLVYMELCDIVKAPSRDRLLCLMKYLLLILKGHNNKSKYALELLRFLSQQLALLSERAANEVCYGLFVNTGKSIIPADMQMEHLVRLTKCHLRTMCSNVTDSSLAKRSSAFFGMDEISKNIDKETSSIKRSQKHKRLSSIEDEQKIIKELRVVRPFLNIPGRHTETLKMTKNPITKLNMEALIKWIEQYKLKFYYEL
ncbi:uncharacterized protein LOC123528628 [Mercenaria mercenaria]|uniref:uncharacterized protein LOC123528628 n=1 Tax=Mercenaria mercenaria TaxID=6596 RepID=UPI00234EE174|nr:uncharacterized protein LOC123528628 [Mercenaria mercenaria]